MKNQIRGKKGITLIALVITIIVLLILAGVTIATLTGDNGLLTKAGEAKNASEQANLLEELQLALIEGQTDKYFNSNSNMDEKLKAIFEKSYGQGNIDVTKAGKNYKAKVKNSKTAYRIKLDGTVEKYEEMDPTNIYGKLDDTGTLYIRATPKDNYSEVNKTNGAYFISKQWNVSLIKKVIIEEEIAPISTKNMFNSCNKLENIENMRYLHTENSTSMESMFLNCNSLKELDVSYFDTSKVTSMPCMFGACSSITDLDVTGFDVSNVYNITQMFDGCSSLNKLDVSGFNTSNINIMSSMFSGCKSLKTLDVSNFDTSNVINMNKMFSDCKALEELDLNNFDTSKVSNMNRMFQINKSLKKLQLGELFKINENTTCEDMFFEIFENIKIISTDETKGKIIELYPSLAENFQTRN